MVEVEKVLKTTVKKGKVKFGLKQTKQAIKDKTAKLVVIADNCHYKEEIKKFADSKKTPVYHSKSSSVDLGYTCGKSFAVSSFVVIDDGGTNIIELTKK